MSEFTWNDDLENRVRRALGKQNRDNAVRLSELAHDQAPIENGDLRGSLLAGDEHSLFAEESDGLLMTVGSNLPYAAKQHEDLSLNHGGPKIPGGKAKFLEDPLNENRSRFMGLLAAAAREAMQAK